MIERIGIVSARSVPAAPSQLCASEFENVLRDMLSATVVHAMEDQSHHLPFDRLIFVAMNYWQLSRMIERTSRLRQRSGSCQAYVFDAFHRYLMRWTVRFPAPLRRASRLMRHELRNLRATSRIFVPTSSLLAEQQSFLEVAHEYLPIGVDAVRFGSARPDRTIDVNAYGRQPRALTNLLSDTLNVRDGRHRFNHTDHLASVTVRDPERHRALFWRMLTDSKVALAYAPEATGDEERFDCPFVGQRWYEAIAAGCAVMGRKPNTPEADTLFNWPDALIELPDDPRAAQLDILTLAHDPARLAMIAQRNHRRALARHDWRHRIDAMSTTLRIEGDEIYRSELTRAFHDGDGGSQRSSRSRPTLGGRG